ncbi:related to regulatory protein for the arginine catabolic pathway [Phialocephala subalpina]|uniref:Related to regulatory protein for the arginine catabolic pathway n=1 Tax=Phialocephala subalpina TaxID=576137 RepID=A0A1L7XXP7_9HELO|nr:related to regulatory protein for the arginine catabolic pathway [Phialocephala subalpina]
MNDSDDVSFSVLPSKKTRTRSGCLNCRRRRRKCDESRPQCANCRQRAEECEWGMKVVFRTDNATQIDSEHPSMLEGSRKRARHFKIVDVTSQIEKNYQGDPSTKSADVATGDVDSTTPSTDNNASPRALFDLEARIPSRTNDSHTQHQTQWQSKSPSFDTPKSMTASHPDEISFLADEDQYMQTDGSPGSGSIAYQPRGTQQYSENTQHNTSRLLDQSTISPDGSPISRINTEDAAADLLALRYLPTQQQSTHSNTISQVLMPTPSNASVSHAGNELPFLEQEIFDYQQDGIFWPGSAYQEFHSTLRDHLIYTARSNAPTRHGTPEPAQLDLNLIERQASRRDRDCNRTDSDPESDRPSKPPEITPEREYILWKAWIDEIAPWLDKFDNNRHFEHKIPMIAKSTPHLKNSILALSARQIEMKGNSKSLSESLALYQEAIHLLLPELQTKNAAVIASCVILCVLEMMSCSPNEWRRHLEGCANLLEAVGINGFVGGVEEALFWCFIRMDLCGALISQDVTLIPVDRWASNIDFASDIRLFRNPANGFDTYANYAVFLCASCVAYLKNCSGGSRGKDEMKPILTIPAAQGDTNSPFPTVLYGNGPAVSGNQLYHTALLLMLQEKPNGLQPQRKQKSIFWHARQICAISESNTHHGAWTNSIQPIWIAGKVMSHPSEHKAILNIYERIERETGWVTSWRREDLKAWWGDSDD